MASQVSSISIPTSLPNSQATTGCMLQLRAIRQSFGATFNSIFTDFTTQTRSFQSLFSTTEISLEGLHRLLDKYEQGFSRFSQIVNLQAEKRKLFWKNFETEMLQTFAQNQECIPLLCELMDRELRSIASLAENTRRITESLRLLRETKEAKGKNASPAISRVFSIARGIFQGQRWQVVDPSLQRQSNPSRCLLRGPDGNLYSGRIFSGMQKGKNEAFEKEVSCWQKFPPHPHIPSFVCCYKSCLAFEHAGIPFTQVFPFSSTEQYYKTVRSCIKELGNTVSDLHHLHFLHGHLDSDKVKIKDRKLQLSDFEFSNEIGTKACFGVSFFSAPEACCDDIPKTEAADIWSIGMILFHLWTGQPFGGGLIDARVFYNILLHDRREGVLVGYFLPQMPLREEAVDMLEKILKLDPRKRMKWQELLAHPYFKKEERSAFHRVSKVEKKQ